VIEKDGAIECVIPSKIKLSLPFKTSMKNQTNYKAAIKAEPILISRQ
jgi:hypothetical protein